VAHSSNKGRYKVVGGLAEAKSVFAGDEYPDFVVFSENGDWFTAHHYYGVIPELSAKLAVCQKIDVIRDQLDDGSVRKIGLCYWLLSDKVLMTDEGLADILANDRSCNFKLVE
jgi:hypothetical protein